MTYGGSEARRGIYVMPRMPGNHNCSKCQAVGCKGEAEGHQSFFFFFKFFFAFVTRTLARWRPLFGYPYHHQHYHGRTQLLHGMKPPKSEKAGGSSCAPSYSLA